MAQVHSRAARAAGATTAVLASSSRERALTAAQDLGIERAADDLAELLTQDVDVVHVCTPNATHAAFALAVIEAGVHVICEKPLATHVDDARDGAQAVLRALETAPLGFDHFLIAAADTVMTRPNAELVAEVFPDVEVRGELGVNDSLFSTAKAERLLGYAPQHSWRDHV